MCCFVLSEEDLDKMIVQPRAFLFSAAVLLLPTTQATASCIIAGFSGAASICGAASVTGYSTGQMNQTATPLLTQENSTGVSVGASGGGPGIGGFASATGTFGTVKMFTSSFTSWDTGINTAAYAQADIGFLDGFTVGPTYLNVHFESSISGTLLGGGAAGYGHFDLINLSANQFVVYDKKLFVYSGNPVSSFSYDLTLEAGATYVFDWSMRADARSVTERYSFYPSALADLSHTGRLTIDVLTPGGGALAFSAERITDRLLRYLASPNLPPGQCLFSASQASASRRIAGSQKLH
jgi:hypothetical protein